MDPPPLTHHSMQVSSGLLGIGARKEKQWPTDLLPLAHGLYNLQRSRMLAAPLPPPHAVHPNERLLLMLQLLAAGRASAEAQVGTRAGVVMWAHAPLLRHRWGCVVVLWSGHG
eukprot:1158780-Pelagomonas_calceolata.AAC.10